MARLTPILAASSLLVVLAGCASDDPAPLADAGSSDERVALAAYPGAVNATMTAALDDEDGEEEIPLSEVPTHVIEAALAAVPGITLEEAEREIGDGGLVYEVEGVKDGHEYEIEISADGTVLEIEIDDDEDDPDDDED